eukprot:TRINITY_DN37950_c0_g2_i1.p1 TRINITY_DN37950_c0_g2~~TRINITY_DN37950_c0_g2_i1.p1  ORF type:complete len:432 (-),score=46.97 TRINITY_DN37950_c0_g2_i1:392-1687(-)
MPADYQFMARNLYDPAQGAPKPGPLSKEEKEELRCTCDCMGIPGGLALATEGSTGCDPNKCTAALCFVECPSNCRSGPKCGNQRIRKRQSAAVSSKKCEGSKGKGLFAMTDLVAEQFVIEYVGEALSYQAHRKRTLALDGGHPSVSYVMKLNGDLLLDSSIKGNMARFTNHSCDPNCETQKWNVDGEIRIGIFSTRAIRKGEELSMDYQFEHYGGKPTKCECGAAKCRGYLGAASAVETIVCTKCSRGDDESNLIICERCRINAQHVQCAGLAKVPKGEWFCPECRAVRKATKKAARSRPVPPAAVTPQLQPAKPAKPTPTPLKAAPITSTEKPTKKQPRAKPKKAKRDPVPLITPPAAAPVSTVPLHLMTERQQFALLIERSKHEIGFTQPSSAGAKTADQIVEPDYQPPKRRKSSLSSCATPGQRAAPN